MFGNKFSKRSYAFHGASSVLLSALVSMVGCEAREERIVINPANYSGSTNVADSSPKDTTGGTKSTVPAAVSPAPPPAKVSSISVNISPIVVDTSHDSFFPRALKLANNNQIAVYAANIDTFQTIRTALSDDDGKSWHEFGEVFREISTADRFLSDPAIIQTPSGAVLAIFKDNSLGVEKLLVSVSVDNGFTWQPQGEVNSSLGANVLDVRQPAVVLTAKGELRVFYTQEKAAGGDFGIVMKSSADEGKTWSVESKVVAVAKGSTSFPGVVRLNDGSLMMTYDAPRSDVDPRTAIFAIQSNDDGATWSNPTNAYLPTKAGKTVKAPQLALLDDGRVMVAFNSDEDAVQAVECCSIRMLISDKTVTFSDLKWAPQAITAIDGVDNLFPSLLNKGKNEMNLIYEKNKKLLTNKIVIGDPQ